jgi:hypothetical protein
MGLAHNGGKTMATMALPIRELELSVRVGAQRARAEAECAFFYSQARADDPVRMTIKYVLAAILLRLILGHLVRCQRALIRAYQEKDFNHCSSDELIKSAERLEKINEFAGPVLCKLEQVSPRTLRVWGNVVLSLRGQFDHFQSIAQSLRSAADPEVSLLMGMAVRHMAAN